MLDVCIKKIGVLLVFSLIGTTLLLASPQVSAQYVFSQDQKLGISIDKIVFNVVNQDDQQVLTLQDDEIDIIGDWVDPTFLETLQEVDNIEVSFTERNGYGYFVINCEKYPFNITAFRRALAFALDKYTISDTAWDGLAEPQDSVIPKMNPWSIEGQLDYSYYDSNIERGNYLLDQASFDINETTGFRTAPNGDAFEIILEVAQSSNIALETSQMAVDAMEGLHIKADISPPCYCGEIVRLYLHGDYDMAFLGSTFSNFDVDWLAYEFWSENTEVPYTNLANFQNASFDAWRDQLLHATSYEDVYEAAIEMQRILTFECPWIYRL